MVGVRGFEPLAAQALPSAYAPTRSPLRGNRSGMTTKRPRVFANKYKDRIHKKSGFCLLVGVSGFEPEASWTRTKRDTKLRHTPLATTL